MQVVDPHKVILKSAEKRYGRVDQIAEQTKAYLYKLDQELQSAGYESEFEFSDNLSSNVNQLIKKLQTISNLDAKDSPKKALLEFNIERLKAVQDFVQENPFHEASDGANQHDNNSSPALRVAAVAESNEYLAEFYDFIVKQVKDNSKRVQVKQEALEDHIERLEQLCSTVNQHKDRKEGSPDQNQHIRTEENENISTARSAVNSEETYGEIETNISAYLDNNQLETLCVPIDKNGGIVELQTYLASIITAGEPQKSQLAKQALDSLFTKEVVSRVSESTEFNPDQEVKVRMSVKEFAGFISANADFKLNTLSFYDKNGLETGENTVTVETCTLGGGKLLSKIPPNACSLEYRLNVNNQESNVKGIQYLERLGASEINWIRTNEQENDFQTIVRQDLSSTKKLHELINKLLESDLMAGYSSLVVDHTNQAIETGLLMEVLSNFKIATCMTWSYYLAVEAANVACFSLISALNCIQKEEDKNSFSRVGHSDFRYFDQGQKEFIDFSALLPSINISTDLAVDFDLADRVLADPNSEIRDIIKSEQDLQRKIASTVEEGKDHTFEVGNLPEFLDKFSFGESRDDQLAIDDNSSSHQIGTGSDINDRNNKLEQMGNGASNRGSSFSDQGVMSEEDQREIAERILEYHKLLDNAAQNINEVINSTDLLDSNSQKNLIQDCKKINDIVEEQELPLELTEFNPLTPVLEHWVEELAKGEEVNQEDMKKALENLSDLLEKDQSGTMLNNENALKLLEKLLSLCQKGTDYESTRLVNIIFKSAVSFSSKDSDIPIADRIIDVGVKILDLQIDSFKENDGEIVKYLADILHNLSIHGFDQSKQQVADLKVKLSELVVSNQIVNQAFAKYIVHGVILKKHDRSINGINDLFTRNIESFFKQRLPNGILISEKLVEDSFFQDQLQQVFAEAIFNEQKLIALNLELVDLLVILREYGFKQISLDNNEFSAFIQNQIKILIQDPILAEHQPFPLGNSIWPAFICLSEDPHSKYNSSRVLVENVYGLAEVLQIPYPELKEIVARDFVPLFANYKDKPEPSNSELKEIFANRKVLHFLLSSSLENLEIVAGDAFRSDKIRNAYFEIYNNNRDLFRESFSELISQNKQLSKYIRRNFKKYDQKTRKNILNTWFPAKKDLPLALRYQSDLNSRRLFAFLYKQNDFHGLSVSNIYQEFCSLCCQIVEFPELSLEENLLKHYNNLPISQSKQAAVEEKLRQDIEKLNLKSVSTFSTLVAAKSELQHTPGLYNFDNLEVNMPKVMGSLAEQGMLEDFDPNLIDVYYFNDSFTWAQSHQEDSEVCQPEFKIREIINDNRLSIEEFLQIYSLKEADRSRANALTSQKGIDDLRNWQPGDSKASINWRATARSDKLIVGSKGTSPVLKEYTVLLDPDWLYADAYAHEDQSVFNFDVLISFLKVAKNSGYTVNLKLISYEQVIKDLPGKGQKLIDQVRKLIDFLDEHSGPYARKIYYFKNSSINRPELPEKLINEIFAPADQLLLQEEADQILDQNLIIATLGDRRMISQKLFKSSHRYQNRQLYYL